MIRGQNLEGVWGKKDSFMMPEAEQWGLAIKSDDFFMNQEVLRIFPLVQSFAFLPSCDRMYVVEFQGLYPKFNNPIQTTVKLHQ